VGVKGHIVINNIKSMIKFKERKSNKIVSEKRKDKMIEMVYSRLISHINEVIAKISVCTLYDYDEIDINIKHKIKF
jgi:hypothetical protein